MEDREKLVEAIKTLRNECQKHNNCEDCLLDLRGECGIMKRPDKYKLRDETDKILI